MKDNTKNVFRAIGIIFCILFLGFLISAGVMGIIQSIAGS